MGYLSVEKKWVFPLVISSLVCVFLLATSFNMGLVSSLHTINSIFSIFPSRLTSNGSSFVESKINQAPPLVPPPLPKFAYLISGSKGDVDKLWRTLHALYHPWNYYIVHLDLESPLDERWELTSRVVNHTLFTKVGNVIVNNRSNMVTYRGPTMVSNTLHACAILLNRFKDWDWFINLSASDYPLVTQDDLLDTFADLKRDLNFVEHTSDLGWKAAQRAMPLIIDPGLYQTTKSDVFAVGPKRNLPTAFKLFTEGYFQTVICNAPQFVPTVVNHDMHYISWDNPPQQHPHTLSVNDTADMIASDAPFARKFRTDDPVLDQIDLNLLRRKKGGFTPGGWCAGKPRCSRVGNRSKLRPSPGAQRLQRLIGNIVFSENFTKAQCF
ncbi:beta-glucuronosyltransferase GlcAT14B-like isoform X2 [Salvia hispanica]|uniref:beta-glucuronosyltransferase GlcAT14B-like isoform X2 n=1 Tax=Salvia hispanica TaxID=49212 RepID=UPI002009824D|nr:beta-glucuronosyltransferase GlcAT14B-like isoform X2 [Salvia hispanica]